MRPTHHAYKNLACQVLSALAPSRSCAGRTGWGEGCTAGNCSGGRNWMYRLYQRPIAHITQTRLGLRVAPYGNVVPRSRVSQQMYSKHSIQEVKQFFCWSWCMLGNSVTQTSGIYALLDSSFTKCTSFFLVRPRRYTHG